MMLLLSARNLWRPVLAAAASLSLCAQTPAGNELFEKEIRPILVEKCYGCHSSKLKSPMGGLVLDTKAGLKHGGNGGPVLIANDPKGSRLLQALTYEGHVATYAPHRQTSG